MLTSSHFKIIRQFGMFLLILVTLILSFLIPLTHQNITDLTNEITELEYKRNIRLDSNWQDYQNLVIKEKIIRLTALFLENINASDNDLNDIYDEYVEARKQAVGKVYIIQTGNVPSKELSDKWDEMKLDDLLNEEKEMWCETSLHGLLDDIKTKRQELGRLENRKSKYLILATILQLFGLIFINLQSLRGENQNKKQNKCLQTAS